MSDLLDIQATWQTHHVNVKWPGYLRDLMTNTKVLFLKKICGMLLFETLKNKKSDFLIFWIVTRVSARDHTVFILHNQSHARLFHTHWSWNHKPFFFHNDHCKFHYLFDYKNPATGDWARERFKFLWIEPKNDMRLFA